ncbi:4'-phosphopantetheinyl transferase EntD (siderophore biosynthesis) [Pseudorhodobacter antarcticus]|uniref:Enterobactin synthase component D n=1 Tax=Pseudorhodobacter antarcticus TaxID=1077947 RepID=A0A1H8FLZ1_9RHOB|nr:4'-phosphopantetheinyl transferase superfamily protein [Pseudorhodobacter antarcticus]SEN32753.1 4'-phosphopantetheinyl transferase EntD (siderophore biosynthesis) [Pseudorhodobacter antarcticus]
MTNLAALLTAARALATGGPTIAWAATYPTQNAPLWPGESISATPKRALEFAAGRAAARMAMAALNIAPTAIPHGDDRAPIWPPGLNGSITHSATACLAALTRAPTLIGIDLEPATPLDPDLWPIILSPSERSALGPNAALQAKLIFSAKEATYKAQYPRSQTLLDYMAMEITLGPQTFTARFTLDVPGFPKNTQLTGHHTHSQNHVLTLVTA